MEVMDKIHEFFEATSSTTARPTIRLGNGKEMKFPPLEFTVDSLVFNICLPFAVLTLGYLVFFGTNFLSFCVELVLSKASSLTSIDYDVTW
jgi:hypothetical protein